MSLSVSSGSEVTAEGMLSALNGCYKRVLGHRKPLQLLGAPSGEVMVPLLADQAVQRQRHTSSKERPQPGRQQQQQQHATVVRQLSEEQQGYWSPGKAAFWSMIGLFRQVLQGVKYVRTCGPVSIL